MNAEIITIGDEILIGQIIDTNSSWLAERLNLAGISVRQMTSISDSRRHILDTLQRAEKENDVVLITGGLGPTSDDITKTVLTEYFDTQLVENKEVLEHISILLKNRSLSLNELNKKQALLPENCRVLKNETGTAAGMWFEKNGTVFISLPGVPFEMKHISEKYVIPMLCEKYHTTSIIHHTIQTYGVSESALAEKIRAWESELPEQIKLAYLPSPERLRLRMSTKSKDKESAQAEIKMQSKKLENILGDIIFGSGDIFLEQVVGNLLKAKKKTVSTAESCTGGNISRLLTSVPGSSDYFKGGITAYSNEIKMSILSVDLETLRNFGAVSKETAGEMAVGVKNLCKTDYSVAVTGIAGPGGETEDKPVGTVWIAVSSDKETLISHFVFGNQRDINIRRASSMALNLLRKLLLSED
jgi:nicotinamide-nucleotide amidase